LVVNAVRRPRFERWNSRRLEEVVGGLQDIRSAKLHHSEIGPYLYVVAGHGATDSQLHERIRASLFVHFGQTLDRGQIDIGHAPRLQPLGDDGPRDPTRLPDRFVLIEYRTLTDARGRVKAQVTIEWEGRQFQGSATGSDVAPSALDSHVLATLRAIESAVGPAWLSEQEISLHLEGASHLAGIEAPSVLVAINAVKGQESVSLAGAVGAADNENRAAILATLRATDRWVRGQLSS